MNVKKKYRIGTWGFSQAHPSRISVSKVKTGWRVFRGTQHIASSFKTFAEAIEYAQKQARQ